MQYCMCTQLQEYTYTFLRWRGYTSYYWEYFSACF